MINFISAKRQADGASAASGEDWVGGVSWQRLALEWEGKSPSPLFFQFGGPPKFGSPRRWGPNGEGKVHYQEF